ncbi:MAG: hypothetical protein ABI619_13425 [Betaproteobacteria bacterium]
MTRTQNAPPAQTAEQVELVETSLEEIQQEIESLKKRMASSAEALESLPSFDEATLSQMAANLDDDADRLRGDIDDVNKKIVDKQRQAAKERQDAATAGRADEEQLADLQEQIEQAQEQLDQIDSSDQMFFTSGIQGKTTFIIEITAAGFAVAQIGVKAPPQRFSSAVELQQWMAPLPPSSNAFYLIVKPSGVANFTAVQSLIRQQGFEFGFDLISDAKKVIDQQNGVSAP